MIGTAVGGALQLISKKYLENHPELLKNTPDAKEVIPRGGDFITGAAITQVLSFLAENGALTGFLSGLGILIGRIPIKSFSHIIRESMPSSLTHLEKEKYITVEGEKISLDYCDDSLKYLLTILDDDTIPFEEKKERHMQY